MTATEASRPGLRAPSEDVSTASSAGSGHTRGFRPGSRRRVRVAAGVAIAAIAVIGNVLVYASLDDSTEVVQFTSNVAAGDLITSADVRIVEVDADLESTDLVPAERIDTIVNQYARTFIPSRSLANQNLVRSTPLVSPGAAVVAIEPAGGRTPSGLTERSRVQLVIDGREGTATVSARVVAISGDDDPVLSIELAEADAAVVAAADEVHVVLLDPGDDPALVTGDG